MDRRQRNRLLSFLLILFFNVLSLIANDFIWRFIPFVLSIAATGMVIYLRETLPFMGQVSEPEPEPNIVIEPPKYVPDADESFTILTPNATMEVQSGASYPIDGRNQRQTLIPPDLKEKFEEIATESIPEGVGQDGQFSFALEKILYAIKDSLQAHSVIFFWYNKKKEKLTIDSYISNASDIERRKFDVTNDVLSKIVLTGEPELLNDINSTAERDAIIYYKEPQSIRSFVGVPLFYNKQLIAVISADSKFLDSFGVETIYTLGRFVRVITMMISLFEEKYTENVSQQRLKSLLSLISSEKRFESDEDLISSIHKSVADIIRWDAFAFVYYYPVEQKFKVAKVINSTSLKYIGESLEVELNNSSTGKAILTGIPVKVDDTSSGEVVRFSKMEDVSFDGSFLAVPLIFNNQNYGVLCFESLKKNAFTNSDVQFLKNSLTMLAFVIYSYSTQKVLKSYIALDVETKVLNAETFKDRLAIELLKADDLKLPGSLALIRIDDFLEQESLFDGNPFPKVLTSVAEMISQDVPAYCLLGRLTDKIFGVYFFNASTKDVYLWAEKLRVKIARKPIAVVSKQTTYTVSIGVASANQKTSVDEVINNANLALQKALEAGGNKVKNIN